MIIKKIHARQVIDSNGYPTVECDAATDAGIFRAMVPSGASTGRHEAVELRDGGNAFFGKGVLKAISNVNKIIAPKLIGRNCLEQEKLDRIMIELDGTENKSKLGANAILSVSAACCKAGAASLIVPLYKYIGKLAGNKEFVLPIPMMVFLEGGKHADHSTDLQEFMIMPVGANSFSQAVQYCVEVYHALKESLKSKGMNTSVGYEGAFSPRIGNEEAFELLINAIEDAGYKPKSEIGIALDAAASELCKDGKYYFASEKRQLNSGEMIDFYDYLIEKYPIVSIEDGLGEDDWEAWIELNKRIGKKVQIIGDDLTVTNPQRLERAIKLGAINSILIKLNQIGSVTETANVVKMAKEKKLKVIVSHRSGETEDTFVADFAVGVGADQCKFGAPTRSERTAKYNQLLRIEEEIKSYKGFYD